MRPLTKTVQTLKVLSRTSNVNDWLASTHHPRILHVFDRACNLINEHREVLSIVDPSIGNGPFNLVLEENVLFSELEIESPVSIVGDQFQAGRFIISTANARLWDPGPDWEALHIHRDEIAARLANLPSATNPVSNQLFSTSLFSALSTADTPSARAAARQLAGLGVGLTPSGDDFLVGAMHAAWIIHQGKTALLLTTAIAETAAPLTTSLSAAWIRSAGRGEAGELWHDFFDALTSGHAGIQRSFEKILSVGETSGADALAGFIGTMNCCGKGNIAQRAIK